MRSRRCSNRVEARDCTGEFAGHARLIIPRSGVRSAPRYHIPKKLADHYSRFRFIGGNSGVTVNPPEGRRGQAPPSPSQCQISRSSHLPLGAPQIQSGLSPWSAAARHRLGFTCEKTNAAPLPWTARLRRAPERAEEPAVVHRFRRFLRFQLLLCEICVICGSAHPPSRHPRPENHLGHKHRYRLAQIAFSLEWIASGSPTIRPEPSGATSRAGRGATSGLP